MRGGGGALNVKNTIIIHKRLTFFCSPYRKRTDFYEDPMHYALYGKDLKVNWIRMIYRSFTAVIIIFRIIVFVAVFFFFQSAPRPFVDIIIL